jgi:hypothetical protein
MEKQEAIKIAAGFQAGAISCANAHLGFDITADRLTQSQAKKFHKFVEPLLTRVYAQVSTNSEKVKELENVYATTMPDELLCYLLKEELTSQAAQV